MRDGGTATFRQFPGTVSGALGGDLEVQGFSNAAPSLGSALVENLGAQRELVGHLPLQQPADEPPIAISFAGMAMFG